MDIIYFASQAEFRRWLEEHHDTATEIQVGYYKVASGVPSITYKESVDEALCFGWIDGIRRSVVDKRYTLRFTPRKPRSIWSAVNLKRFAELQAAGKVHPSGQRTFDTRNPAMVNQYSFEQPPDALRLTAEQEARFKANAGAWGNFEKMPPSYRKAAIWWVVSAKQDATRQKRLDELIADSARGLRVKPLRRKTDRQE
jgi:uncharacterized protein YdeI (YjbR/CyaY-like superfamily)